MGLGVEVFGASVRGPAHAVTRLPNQDAWAHARAGTARVVVVSDGMGSRPHAREGARAACRAVVDAVRQWRRYPSASVDILLGLVHLLWRARISPRPPEDCACTCLFAVVEQDGSGVAAQLGDGLVLTKDVDGTSSLGSRVPDAFTNETLTLGVTSQLSAWQRVSLERRPRALVLCTDGVADDLLPHRLGDFVDWLVCEVRTEAPAGRRHILEQALRQWPTPNHLDDKTIAVIFVPEIGS